MKRICYAFIALLLTLGAAHAQKFQADSNINISSTIIGIGSTTAKIITPNSATVYSIDAMNVTSDTLFLKLYNAATATCGSGTPFARYVIPGGASGTNVVSNNINGDSFVNGIVMCISKGLSDTDTTAPNTNAGVVNIHWKQGQK